MNAIPIVLAVLGGIAALANDGGPVDALLGAVIWLLIGAAVVWVIAKVRRSDATGD